VLATVKKKILTNMNTDDPRTLLEKTDIFVLIMKFGNKRHHA
jgi:hypothetical protein